MRPEGAKDEVKRPEGPPVRSRGPEDPYTSSTNVNVNTNLNTMQRDGLEKSSNLYCSRMKLVKKLISFSGTKFQHIDKLFTSTLARYNLKSYVEFKFNDIVCFYSLLLPHFVTF